MHTLPYYIVYFPHESIYLLVIHLVSNCVYYLTLHLYTKKKDAQEIRQHLLAHGACNIAHSCLFYFFLGLLLLLLFFLKTLTLDARYY